MIRDVLRMGDPRLWERSDLVRQFGERYRRYRRQVGMLIPRGKSFRRTAGNEAGRAD